MSNHLTRLLRFAIVGITATLTYACFAFVLSYGQGSAVLPAAVASFAAYVLATPVSYLGHKYLTFVSDGAHLLEAPRFAASVALGIGISCLLPLVLVDGLGFPPAASILSACVVVPAVNYFVLGRWVFSSEANPGQGRAAS